MKVIIAGGRDFDRMTALLQAIKTSGFGISEVVSGACRVKKQDPYAFASGADGLGEKWALVNGIPVKRFYAEDYGDWPACGPKRNVAMAEYVAEYIRTAKWKYAGGLIALPGGNGTKCMIAEAQSHGLEIFKA